MSVKFTETLIRLGATNPELRPHIRPLLAAVPKVELSKAQKDALPNIVRRLEILARPHGAKALAVQARKLQADMVKIVGARGFSRDPRSAEVVKIMLGRIIEVSNAVDALLTETVGMPRRGYSGTLVPYLEEVLWDAKGNFPESKPLLQDMLGLKWFDVEYAKTEIKADMPGMESFEALKQRAKTDQA